MRPRRALTALLLAAAAAVPLSACEDFATPSDLDRVQIIAVIAEPPMVEPGGQSILSVVLAGPDGIVPTPAVSWTVLGLPGRPPRGEVVVDLIAARYLAPATVDDQPTVAPLEARLEVDGRTLVASKLVGIGPLDLVNPVLTGLSLDGEPIVDDSVVVARGAAIAVSADVEAEPSADVEWSWYSTAGEIEAFRSNPAELVVGDRPGVSWLIAVVRDQGGQSVRAARLMVE